MKCVVFVLQVVLLYNYVYNYVYASAGDRCFSDADCDPWLGCENNVCSWCKKETVVCNVNDTGILSKCCDGTTCESIPGLNLNWCAPNENKCTADTDCSHGLKCILRLGKCGVCLSDGEKCSLPYDTLECCNSWCAINNNGQGICADPRAHIINLHQVPKRITTTTEPPPPECVRNSDCRSWMSCIDNKCLKCTKETAVCEGANDLWPCCPGTTCEKVPGTNMTWCLKNKNKCEVDADCPPSLKCIQSKKKCGICKGDNEPCSALGNGQQECCSNFCNLSDRLGEEQLGAGTCRQLRYNFCSSWRDCIFDRECIDGRCGRCQRNYSFCRIGNDCCSGKCSDRDNHLHGVSGHNSIGGVKKLCIP